jgi:4-hydroxy-2-oxoheptanedioate aldolase
MDRPVLGAALTMPSSQVVEILCAAGAEFLFIDTEHTLIDRAVLVSMLQAAEIWQTPVIVRAAWNAPELVGWPLDFGAEGVSAPMIETAEDAERFIRCAHYPPTGERSFGGATNMVSRSGASFNVESRNRRTVCVAMIETRAAFENIDAITSVKGLDGVFVGQSDFGIAYGLHPSDGREDPGHLDRIKHIAEVALRNGVAPFINCEKSELLRPLRQMGYRCFMRSDVGLFLSNAKAEFGRNAEIARSTG